MRLHEETPARKALKEAMRKSKKHRGGQKMTWLGVIKDDLKPIFDVIEMVTGLLFRKRRVMQIEASVERSCASD